MTKKLAIVTTHPIQYYAPLFRKLAESNRLEVKVYYTWSQAQNSKFDPGFKKMVEWDIPLLEGYEFEFIENVSLIPGTKHPKGIINPTLNHKIEAWHPDAILVFGWNYDSHFKAMKYFKGKTPVYFRGDSHLLDPQPIYKKIMRKIYLTYVYRFIDKAFYVGSANKAYYKWCGLKDEQLVFAPHSVDNERFNSQNAEFHEEAAKLRISLGIKLTDVVFLFAGKFESKKRPDLLVSLFKKNQTDQFHLVFVGNGELENQLKKNSDDFRNRIHFLPFANQLQMPIIYRIADWFIYPSQGPGETWGLAINEAMASGTPCIVSDKVGCANDVIINKKNGFVFKSNNSDELEKIFHAIKNNPGFRKRFSENALDHIKQFDMNKTAFAITQEIAG